MKRTSFKKMTFEEAIAKKRAADQRRREKMKAQGFPVRKPVVKKKKVRKKRSEMTKAERVKILKKKLWVIFSQYIRKKHANHAGMVQTCDGKFKHWQQTDCGHLFHNSERSQALGGNELWYYENNFAPQSRDGNRFNAQDSAKEYMLFAVRKFGLKEVEKMQRMKLTPRKFTEEELVEKFEHYKREFAKL